MTCVGLNPGGGDEAEEPSLDDRQAGDEVGDQVRREANN